MLREAERRLSQREDRQDLSRSWDLGIELLPAEPLYGRKIGQAFASIDAGVEDELFGRSSNARPRGSKPPDQLTLMKVNLPDWRLPTINAANAVLVEPPRYHRELPP